MVPPRSVKQSSSQVQPTAFTSHKSQSASVDSELHKPSSLWLPAKMTGWVCHNAASEVDVDSSCSPQQVLQDGVDMTARDYSTMQGPTGVAACYQALTAIAQCCHISMILYEDSPVVLRVGLQDQLAVNEDCKACKCFTPPCGSLSTMRAMWIHLPDSPAGRARGEAILAH